MDNRRAALGKRPDLSVISEIIPRDVRILDLGCGDGSLLYILRHDKNVSGSGIEIDQDKILDCVSVGVPVVQGDLNDGLAGFPDKSFDYVVLSQTLQAVERPDRLLAEMMRVGDKAVVSLINMGHFSARLQFVFKGKMPVTETLPYNWYDTPNIHLATIRDFRQLCREMDIRIEEEVPLGAGFLGGLAPNLFAWSCVFVLSGANPVIS